MTLDGEGVVTSSGLVEGTFSLNTEVAGGPRQSGSKIDGPEEGLVSLRALFAMRRSALLRRVNDSDK